MHELLSRRTQLEEESCQMMAVPEPIPPLFDDCILVPSPGMQFGLDVVADNRTHQTFRLIVESCSKSHMRAHVYVRETRECHPPLLFDRDPEGCWKIVNPEFRSAIANITGALNLT